MKKLTPLLLLIFVIAFQPGCKKDSDTVGETNAHVLDGGNPEIDGLGYYIKLDASNEDVVAINLPSSYRTPGVNAPVAIKFLDTGNRRKLNWATANLGLRVVYIVTIRKL